MAEFEFSGSGFAPYDEVKSAIWEMFRQKMILLNNANILEPGWEGDPGEQIEQFLADLEEEVDDIYSTGSYEWEVAERMYLQNLAQSEVNSTEFRSDETEFERNHVNADKWRVRNLPIKRPGETVEDTERVGSVNSSEEEASKAAEDPPMNQIEKSVDADRETNFEWGDFRIAFELCREVGAAPKTSENIGVRSESCEEDPWGSYHNFDYIFEEGVYVLLGLYDLENNPKCDDIMNYLLTRFNMDISLAEDDPGLRITEFLSRMDKEICASAPCRKADRINAGKMYLLELCNDKGD